jgi:large subunit ribosomal protein L15
MPEGKKKRKKVTRHHGTHTHGRGAKKKARGKGHRGGIGMAGTGKRADHKKSLILAKFGTKYYGTKKTRRADTKVEIEDINLQRILDNLSSYVKKKIAKKSGESYELDLKGFKVIGTADVKVKLKINALGASKGARESVKKGGGEIVISVKKTIEKDKKKDSDGKE